MVAKSKTDKKLKDLYERDITAWGDAVETYESMYGDWDRSQIDRTLRRRVNNRWTLEAYRTHLPENLQEAYHKVVNDSWMDPKCISTVDSSRKLWAILFSIIWEIGGRAKPEQSSPPIPNLKEDRILRIRRKHASHPPLQEISTNSHRSVMGVAVGSPTNTPMRHATTSRKGCRGIMHNGKPYHGNYRTRAKHSRIKSSSPIPVGKAPIIYPRHPNREIETIQIPKVWFVVILYLIPTLTLFPLFKNRRWARPFFQWLEAATTSSSDRAWGREIRIIYE
jgi:hypothetical protein